MVSRLFQFCFFLKKKNIIGNMSTLKCLKTTKPTLSILMICELLYTDVSKNVQTKRNTLLYLRFVRFILSPVAKLFRIHRQKKEIPIDLSEREEASCRSS